MVTLYRLFAVNTITNEKIEPRGYMPDTRKSCYRQINELVNKLNLGKYKTCCMVYDTDKDRRIYENGYIEIERRYYYDS